MAERAPDKKRRDDDEDGEKDKKDIGLVDKKDNPPGPSRPSTPKDKGGEGSGGVPQTSSAQSCPPTSSSPNRGNDGAIIANIFQHMMTMVSI